MAVLPCPLDCLALRLQGREDVVRVVLDNVIINRIPLGATLGTWLDIDIRHFVPSDGIAYKRSRIADFDAAQMPSLGYAAK
ncbi:MAG: hypothetical protein ACXV3D_09285 [Halobacteriota archaeon]